MPAASSVSPSSTASFPASAEDYAALIKSCAPFAQANYGDGEWLCIFGEEGRNCDGHRYLLELGDDLARTLKEPRPYMHGINPGPKLRRRADDWLRAHRATDILWVEKNILSDANWRGELGPVVRALRTRRVLVVGPPHLRHLPPEVFVPAAFVEVPPVDCYLTHERTIGEILRHADGCDVITFSASMATNVMIWKLWPDLHDKATMIDMGAIFDPYCGVNSRKRYRDAENPERIKRNLL